MRRAGKQTESFSRAQPINSHARANITPAFVRPPQPSILAYCHNIGASSLSGRISVRGSGCLALVAALRRDQLRCPFRPPLLASRNSFVAV